MVTHSNLDKKKFPWGKLIIAAAVIGAAIHWGPGLLKGGAPAGGQQGDGVPVSVADVISQSVTEWSQFSGMLQAVNSVEVRPRISGQIVQIHFEDGAEVKKGQVLFTIDPRPYEAELKRAKGALAAAQASQANAGQEIGRAKKLIKSKAISQSEYETRVSGFAQAEGNFASAQAAVRSAELNLIYTRVTAPITGKISRAEITLGNLVDAGGQAPLLASIVSLSPIYASFEMDEKTFLSTIQGVPAAKLKTIPVEVGLGNEATTTIPATIHSFDNQITPGSGTIRVRASLPNRDQTLVPGLYARVRIGTPDDVESILVNPTAIGTDQNKKFVMVVDKDNKAEYREVTLGTINDGLQIVKTGLSAGEKIVVNGLQRVRPGVPVMGTPVDMKTLAPLNPPAAPATEAAPAAEAKPEDATPEAKPADAPAEQAQ